MSAPPRKASVPRLHVLWFAAVDGGPNAERRLYDAATRAHVSELRRARDDTTARWHLPVRVLPRDGHRRSARRRVATPPTSLAGRRGGTPCKAPLPARARRAREPLHDVQRAQGCHASRGAAPAEQLG